METNSTATTNIKDVRSTLVRGLDQGTVGAHDTIDSGSAAARPAAEALGVKGEQLNRALTVGYLLSRVLSAR